jgi:hypothetical protein
MIWASVYLLNGAVLAAAYYYVVNEALKVRDSDDEVDAALAELERPVAALPGGMPAALILTALLWPAVIVSVIVSAARR